MAVGMSRKSCKRRVYPLNPNIVGHVIEGIGFAAKSKLDKLRLLELSQIESLANGSGTLQDLRGLTDCLNLCETVADAGVGPEALPACEKAQEAILSIMGRYETRKKIEALPAELEALRDLFAFHDLQRQVISIADYERYILKTAARIRSNHPSCKAVI